MALSFLEYLNSSGVLVSDGATGTNLQQRGLERGMPSEVWLFERPDEIIGLHRDFLQAGANILLTNTFGASPLRLEAAGLAGRLEEINRRAVALVRQALTEYQATLGSSERDFYIAGSLGPAGELLKPYGALEETQVSESYAAQVSVLSGAGVDLLLIETQFDLKEASLAVQAAQAASNLPVVCSFSFDRGTRTMMGVRPSQMAAEIAPLGVVALGINCGRSLEDNGKALQELYSATELPIWFKPNAGMPSVDAHGNTRYAISPAEMGALANSWINAGARIVGGCCGTSPEHLSEIARVARN